MSDVVAAALIGAPVFRMLAAVECRDVGTAPHLAIERLLEEGFDRQSQEIPALLGLRRKQVDALLAEFDGSSGRRVRELRVWIDPAGPAVYSTDYGLDLVRRAQLDGAPLLQLREPLVEDLPRELFAGAARTHAQERRRVIVNRVLSLQADYRTRTAQPADEERRGHRDRDERREQSWADHLLLLPDTCLVVRSVDGELSLEVRRGGVAIDLQLTRVAEEQARAAGWLRAQRLSPAAAVRAQERLRAALGVEPTEAYALTLDPLSVRRHIRHACEYAKEQLVILTASDASAWPQWLKNAHWEARRHGVQCVVGDASSAAGAPGCPAGCGILVVRDGVCAVAHSDALLVGAGWSWGALKSQASLEVHAPAAVRRLLGSLDIEWRAPTSSPAKRPLEDMAAEALRPVLERLSGELPAGTLVAMQETDVKALCDLARTVDGQPSAERVEQIARGVAWERVVYTACVVLAASHPQLTELQMRRKPSGEGLDLDVMVHNREQRIWWILDAKHSGVGDRQFNLVRHQLKIAEAEGWVPAGSQARGALVQPLGMGHSPDLEDPPIPCITLEQLQSLLLAGASDAAAVSPTPHPETPRSHR